MYRSMSSAVLALALLAACGGGGSGGSSDQPVGPVIATQPSSQAVQVGQPVTFAVTATGSGLTYQWTRDSAPIDGATGATYTIPASAATDSGAAIQVTVSNTAGSVTSAAATLTVNTSFDDASAHWVGTWATAPYLVDSTNFPPAVPPGSGQYLDNATLRQIVKISMGGSRFRLRLSNRAGNGPVEIQAAHVALSGTSTSIKADTDRVVTYQGSPSFTIPAGKEITSDSFDLTVPATTKVTITLAFGAVPANLTGHPGSRTKSFIIAGSHPGYDSFGGALSTTHWYYIQGLEVAAPDASRSIAILGDSITDGLGSDTDQQNRWTDALAGHLASNASTADVGVLNLGIGGTNVISSGVPRFATDVADQTNVGWLVVLYGVNDIGAANASAADIEAAYQTLIDDAHSANLLAYGIPILPFGGYSAYANGTGPGSHEAVRQEVNAWIRAPGHFDAVIDLEATVADPAQPDQLLAAYTIDGLHLNSTGYALIGQAVPLSLFE